MNTEEKILLLKKTDLMCFIEHDTLRQLAEHCREITLRDNELLFEEGSLEIAMYIVLSGGICIYKGRKQIAILGPGQYLGEMSLIEAKPRSASAKAVGNAILIEITEEKFEKHLANEPKALIAITKTLSSRIRHDLDVMATDLRKLSIFTHDIKNGLTPLSLSQAYIEDLIDLLQGTKSTHKVREGLTELKKIQEIIVAATNTLTTMTNNSLSYSKKIEISYPKKRTDVLPLAEKTIEGISMHIHLKGKKVKLTMGKDVQECILNAMDIERVLQNLIINAGYVTKENGTIEVVANTKAKELQFSVIDKGCGIPEEIRPYLFKDSVTTKSDGNGFGLLSCKEIIEERHYGRFWYETETGIGTTFHFTLPINGMPL
jgi:signal transduction histidine kinase